MMNPHSEDLIPKEFDKRFRNLLVHSKMNLNDNEAVDVVCSVVDEDEKPDWSTDVLSNMRIVFKRLHELTETVSYKYYYYALYMVAKQQEIYLRSINGLKQVQTTQRELCDSQEYHSKIISDIIAINEEDKLTFIRFFQLAENLERKNENLRVQNEKEPRNREAIEAELKKESIIDRKNNKARGEKRRELLHLNEELKEQTASLKKAEADMEDDTRYAHEKNE